MSVRIAYLATHPIQYQAPLLRLIAAEPGIELKAFFRSPMGLKSYVDKGFGQAIAWDVPLLDGYEHEFLPALGDPMRVTPFLRPFNYGLGRRLVLNRMRGEIGDPDGHRVATSSSSAERRRRKLSREK